MARDLARQPEKLNALAFPSRTDNDPIQTYQICREISAPPAKYETMRRAGYQECWMNSMCMLHTGRRQWLKVFPRPFFQDLTFIGPPPNTATVISPH